MTFYSLQFMHAGESNLMPNLTLIIKKILLHIDIFHYNFVPIVELALSIKVFIKKT